MIVIRSHKTVVLLAVVCGIAALLFAVLTLSNGPAPAAADAIPRLRDRSTLRWPERIGISHVRCATLVGPGPTSVAASRSPRRRGPHARCFSPMGDPGLEPGTSSLSEKRSNRLS